MDAQPKIADVFLALKNCLFTISPSLGYTSTLTSANYLTLSREDQDKLADTNPLAYPKVVAVYAGGKQTKQPGRRVYKNAVFIVTIYMLDGVDSGGLDIESQTLNMIEDVERLLSLDNNLGGVVSDTTLKEYYTDATSAYPEGSVILVIEANYYTQY